MENFEYFNPVHIIFGRNSISKIPELLKKRKKVLFLYGKGSIKKNGIYKKIKEALGSVNHIEYGGIEENPEYLNCMECVLLAEKEKIDFILSVGGSSVLDAAKFIGAAFYCKQDEPWDFLTGKSTISKALPIGSFLTTPPTGSEMNCNFVISRREMGEKLSCRNSLLYPQFSILDPETSFSLSKRQIANGIAVSFIHILEQYVTTKSYSLLQDKLTEALIKTLIEEAPKAMMNIKDYEVQANILWCSTNALNGVLNSGFHQNYVAQTIGYEMTALYGIDYGRTLAVVIPGLLNFIRKNKEEKLIQFGERIWGVSMGDANVRIDEAIARTSLFFESLGIDTRYADLNIEEDAPEKIASRIDNKGCILGQNNNIRGTEVIQILKNIMN